MNGAHLHLVLNHLPVIGMVGATILLAWAVLARGNETRRVALIALLLAGVAAVPAYLTGDGAEETIGHQPGVEERRIHAHEDAAKWGLALGIAAGAVALGALVVSRRKPVVPRRAVGVALAVSLLTCLTLARTANLGGEIRHPEVRAGFAAPAEGGQGGEARGAQAGERGGD